MENSHHQLNKHFYNKKYHQELTHKLILKERIWEIDFLRSFPIIIVVLYHACFDVYLLRTMLNNYSELALLHPNFVQFTKFCEDMFFNDTIMTIFVPIFGGIFLFICGISTSLTRSNVRRALLLDLAAVLLSITTYLLSVYSKTDDFIYFGILHQMGTTITIYALIELFSRKVFKLEINKYLILFVGVVLLVVGVVCNVGVGMVKWPKAYIGYKISSELKRDPLAYIKVALGINASYNDWWPILPYSGVIYIGMFFGKLLYGKNKKSIVPKLYWKGFKPLCFIGRHTIYIYLLHQVILVSFFAILFICLGGKFF